MAKHLKSKCQLCGGRGKLYRWLLEQSCHVCGGTGRVILSQAKKERNSK